MPRVTHIKQRPDRRKIRAMPEPFERPKLSCRVCGAPIGRGVECADCVEMERKR